MRRPPAARLAALLLMAVAAVPTALAEDTQEPSASPSQSASDRPEQPSDAVSCELPGQIRALGRGTIVTRGQIVRTTPLHCAQRGGRIVEGR